MKLSELVKAYNFFEGTLTAIDTSRLPAGVLELKAAYFTYTFTEDDEGIYVPGRLRFENVVDFRSNPAPDIIPWTQSDIEILTISHRAEHDADSRESCLILVEVWSSDSPHRIPVEITFLCSEANWIPDSDEPVKLGHLGGADKQ